MGKTVLLAASAVIVTLALPQAASAAQTANGVALKSAIESTVNVDKAGYGYGYGYRHYRPYRYYRPYYYNY
jgi:hypothetical protein